jgi:glucan phosphorylase
VSHATADTVSWWERTRGEDDLLVAYFSMEFGLHERLPIYSGGLGVLAGDHLKAAAELGVPLVGVGLLYRAGTSGRRSTPTAARPRTTSASTRMRSASCARP